MPEVRLIDANALKAKLKIGTNTATYSDYCNGYCDARQVDLDAIDAAPTIEAEPVRHSEWLCVNKEESVWMCDNCGNEIEMKGTNPIKIGIDWCPYCGFRMDGGDDNGKSV